MSLTGPLPEDGCNLLSLLSLLSLSSVFNGLAVTANSGVLSLAVTVLSLNSHLTH